MTATSSIAPRALPEALTSLPGRDLLSIRDLTTTEIRALLSLAIEIKREPARYGHALDGKTLALLFEKPSLRTRVSFDIGIHQLGGHAIYLGPSEIGLGVRESIADVARTLERLVDAIMVRTFAHDTLEELARAASIPVINGLSDFSHPCQALADFLTILELRGTFDGVHLAYVGDGNNVAHSLIYAAALLGVRLSIATPRGYEPDVSVQAWSYAHEAREGTACRVVHDPIEAVSDADVIYTDTWISMGQESESAERRRVFQGFQVDAALLDHARPDGVFMHCLPAHRGEEVSADVIDSPRSVIFQQAENRLHAQKAVLCALLR